MRLFRNKSKPVKYSANFETLSDFQGLPAGSKIQLIQDDETGKLLICLEKDVSRPLAFLSYSQLTHARVISEQEVKEQKTNIIGRAVVGDLLLGPVGALVGGMSAVGKKKIENKRFYIINYRPIDKPKETEVLAFGVPDSTQFLPRFTFELLKKIPEQRAPETPKQL